MNEVKIKTMAFFQGTIEEIEKLLPTRATPGSAGMDLFSLETAIILPRKGLSISSGFGYEIPDGYFGLVCGRSGLSRDHGVRISGGVSAIDSDYRGEVKLPMFNDFDEAYTINAGDRIAQMILIPYIKWTPDLASKLSKTSRGEKGFGDSGR